MREKRFTWTKNDKNVTNHTKNINWNFDKNFEGCFNNLLQITTILICFFTKCTIIWSIFDFLFTCFQMPWNVWLMFNVFRTLSTDVFTILYNVTLIWLLMRANFHMPVMFHSPFENCITANVFTQNLLCLI